MQFLKESKTNSFFFFFFLASQRQDTAAFRYCCFFKFSNRCCGAEPGSVWGIKRLCNGIFKRLKCPGSHHKTAHVIHLPVFCCC